MQRPLAALGFAFAAAAALAAQGPVPGRNVNMVSVDPYLQKQNEPSIAVSTRNPCHLLAGANDYRTVNIPPFPDPDNQEIGDAWVGLYKSFNCGATWSPELMPGYRQDPTPLGQSQPVFGFTTGADPTVRAGLAGTFYYSFIAFNRGTSNGRFVVARFIDRNDKDAGDTMPFLGMTVFDNGSSGQFVDKPTIATGVGSGTCTVNGETIPATNVFAAWTVFVGKSEENIRTKVYFARSSTCGATLDGPATKLSEGYPVNQGAAIGVSADSRTIYVVWRQRTPDAMLFVRSSDGGRSFSKAQAIPTLATLPYFDQGTTPNTFRTVAYPAVAVDHNGRLHVLVSARGFGAGGDARVVHTSTVDGASWTMARAIEGGVEAENGHQIMPALTYAGGRLSAIWYDLRDDYSRTFRFYIDESETPGLRHTLDVRGAQAEIGADSPAPAFAPYGILQIGQPTQTVERLSQYLLGTDGPAPRPLQQLQFNMPNMRLYAGGSAPFMGDYIDVSGLQFVPDRTAGAQTWSLNRSPQDPAFHAVWTDNRDAKLVRENPATQPYTPPDAQGSGLAACVPGHEKTRNANVYTSRIAPGISLTVPGSAKAANIRRAFGITLANGTNSSRAVRLTLTPFDGASASFARNASTQTVDVTVGPRSSAARTVFLAAGASVALPRILVTASTIDDSVPDRPSLSASAIINRDAFNPPIRNPDAPGTSTEPIGTAEVHNPDVANPDVANPDVANPDVANPDVANPDVANPDVANPDVANPDVANPDVANPDVANPDVANPDVANPDVANSDLQNGSLTDVTVEVTNDGNTTSSYQVKSAVTGDTSPFLFQLIGARIYKTPGAKNCRQAFVLNNQILFSIPLPDLGLTFADMNEPDPRLNPTVLIAPGETIRVTLRVIDQDTTDDVRFCIKEGQPGCTAVTHTMYVAAKPQAANTNDPDGEPDVFTNIALPDLTIDGPAALSASTVVPGDSVDLTGATLRNAGTGPAFVRAGFDTSYFLSPLEGTSDGPITLATTNTPSLAPGATQSLDRTGEGDNPLQIPDTLPVGPYQLSVFTDSGRRVVEGVEDNNILNLPLTVVDAPEITTTELPEAQAGSTYSQPLSATGGVGALRWDWVPAGCEIECGFTTAIPPGLTLSPDGTISGTPTTTGFYGVLVRVADSTAAPGTFPARHSDTQFLTISVIGVLVTFTQQPPATVDGPFDVTILVRDPSGAPIAGAAVDLAIEPNDDGIVMVPATLSGLTNEAGEVTFANVQVGGAGPGRLQATVASIGFATVRGYSNVFTVP